MLHPSGKTRPLPRWLRPTTVDAASIDGNEVARCRWGVCDSGVHSLGRQIDQRVPPPGVRSSIYDGGPVFSAYYLDCERCGFLERGHF